MSRSIFVLNLILKTLFGVFLLLCFGIVVRLWMQNSFLPSDIWQSQTASMIRLWKFGLLYDLRIITPALAPFYLLGLLLLGFSPKVRLSFLKYSSYFLGFLAFVYALAWCVNYFYFQTYHTQIDIFIFGAMDDDQSAILKILWGDYPVIQILLICLTYGILSTWLCLKLPILNHHFSLFPLLALNLVFVVFYVFAVRGSVVSTPLLRAQANVSSNPFINHLVPNPIIAFVWASGDYKINSDFFAVSASAGKVLQQKANLTTLYHTTQKNTFLKDNPPNVILNLMESFGTNLLVFDNPKDFDVLGELRTHFQSDFLFKRFLSSGNGTASSLSALYFDSPSTQIAISRVKNIIPKVNVISAYKNAGYRIIFLTTGNASWYGYGDYIRLLGADEVYDLNSMIDAYPEAKDYMSAYGIPDEYLYKILQALLQNTKQPLFVCTLTTSNHPPEIIPSHYKPYPIQKYPKEFLSAKHYPLVPLAYQYANDSFGKFLTWLKDSKFSQNTIVAATGDHRLRSLANFEVEKNFLNYAVPFYLYVPKAYIQATQAIYDPNTLGSHKDIFPTLLALSLSKAQYFSMGGENMLKRVQNRFAYNHSLFADKNGIYIGGGGYYLWKDLKAKDFLSSIEVLSHSRQIPQDLLQKIQAYNDLYWWQIRSRTSGELQD